jgi:hypothetical protein
MRRDHDSWIQTHGPCSTKAICPYCGGRASNNDGGGICDTCDPAMKDKRDLF